MLDINILGGNTAACAGVVAVGDDQDQLGLLADLKDILLQELSDHGRNAATVVGVYQNHPILHKNGLAQYIQDGYDWLNQALRQSIGNMLTVAGGREIVDHAVLL